MTYYSLLCLTTFVAADIGCGKFYTPNGENKHLDTKHYTKRLTKRTFGQKIIHVALTEKQYNLTQVGYNDPGWVGFTGKSKNYFIVYLTFLLNISHSKQLLYRVQ